MDKLIENYPHRLKFTNNPVQTSDITSYRTISAKYDVNVISFCENRTTKLDYQTCVYDRQQNTLGHVKPVDQSYILSTIHNNGSHASLISRPPPHGSVLNLCHQMAPRLHDQRYSPLQSRIQAQNVMPSMLNTLTHQHISPRMGQDERSVLKLATGTRVGPNPLLRGDFDSGQGVPSGRTSLSVVNRTPSPIMDTLYRKTSVPVPQYIGYPVTSSTAIPMSPPNRAYEVSVPKMASEMTSFPERCSSTSPHMKHVGPGLSNAALSANYPSQAQAVQAYQQPAIAYTHTPAYLLPQGGIAQPIVHCHLKNPLHTSVCLPSAMDSSSLPSAPVQESVHPNINEIESNGTGQHIYQPYDERHLHSIAPYQLQMQIPQSTSPFQTATNGTDTGSDQGSTISELQDRSPLASPQHPEEDAIIAPPPKKRGRKKNQRNKRHVDDPQFQFLYQDYLISDYASIEREQENRRRRRQERSQALVRLTDDESLQITHARPMCPAESTNINTITPSIELSPANCCSDQDTGCSPHHEARLQETQPDEALDILQENTSSEDELNSLENAEKECHRRKHALTRLRSRGRFLPDKNRKKKRVRSWR